MLAEKTPECLLVVVRGGEVYVGGTAGRRMHVGFEDHGAVPHRPRRHHRVPTELATAEHTDRRRWEHERVAGLELGADDYLAKPASPREIAARVRVAAITSM